MRKPTR